MIEEKIKLAYMNPENVSKEIGAFVIDMALKHNVNGYVMGLSGGIDSSTTAALIKNAFDIYNETHDNKLELVGYILPSGTNNPADERDAVRVAEQLGIRYEIHSIDTIVDAYRTTNPEALESQYDKGNMMSRIRANVLSTKAATEGKMVAGTGNNDEDFCLGYYTLFGDGAVHISPIGNLSKRLVKEMASYLGLPDDIVNRVPTAGLEPGQTDFGDLGYSYQTAELVIRGLNQGISRKDMPYNSQVRLHINEEISSQPNPKFSAAEDVVYDIFERHEIAKLKASLIHPPAAPVTLEYR